MNGELIVELKKRDIPIWQVKVSDQKSADHHSNLVFGAKN
jgi:hypothetical protein